MFTKWLTIGLVAGFILIGTLSYAQALPRHDWLSEIGQPNEWTVAVLSPLNHVQKQAAYKITVESLERSLTSSGLNIITTAQLRPTLRKHRIRSTGEISIDDAIIIQEQAKCDLILIPSIDFYEASKTNPEFGLSLRLVRPDQMRVVGAVSCSATGRDYIRLFGVGMIKEIDSLIANLADKAVEQLIEQVQRLATQEITTYKTRVMAVVQFDNLSDMKRAGSIITNWTISQLVERGLVVIEPGAVSEIAKLLGDLPVGGIDHYKLKTIGWLYDLNYVITGQIVSFRLARGSSKNSTPTIEFGARLIEAETGRIATTYHCEATGADGHIAFGMGRVRSGGDLLKKQLNDMLDEFKSVELRLTGTYDTK